MTVAEQYQDVLNYLAAHPPIGGREPHRPPAWGGSLPLWDGRRVPDAVAQLYHEIGLRGFLGFASAAARPANLAKTLDVARQRFEAWRLEPNRSVALGTYRNFPSRKTKAGHKNCPKALESKTYCSGLITAMKSPLANGSD